jgi:hypothetical protein
MSNLSRTQQSAMLDAMLHALKNGGGPIECEHCDCAICLKKIHKGEQLTLDCGHKYHGDCIRQWATRTKPDAEYDCIVPLPNRKIYLFNEGENIFSCPCCRVEYTHDIHTTRILKVFAKIHFQNKGKTVVHYITDEMETLEFVPMSNIINKTGKITGKWATILSILKKSWETGTTNIYAQYRLEFEPEFVLRNKNIPIPPLDDIKGMAKGYIKHDQLLSYRAVDVDELEDLINDKPKKNR